MKLHQITARCGGDFRYLSPATADEQPTLAQVEGLDGLGSAVRQQRHRYGRETLRDDQIALSDLSRLMARSRGSIEERLERAGVEVAECRRELKTKKQVREGSLISAAVSLGGVVGGFLAQNATVLTLGLVGTGISAAFYFGTGGLIEGSTRHLELAQGRQSQSQQEFDGLSNLMDDIQKAARLWEAGQVAEAWAPTDRSEHLELEMAPDTVVVGDQEIYRD